ncbi:MAG: helix-turn-helix transcriptional regulator [Nanoarchaeota archaeon]
MENDYDGLIKELGLRVSGIRQNIISEYCDFIKNNYVHLSDNRKDLVEEGLEVIVKNIGSNPEVDNLISPKIGREERIKLGLTQQELADQLGVVRQSIVNYENGIVKTNTGKNIKKYLAWMRERIGDKK